MLCWNETDYPSASPLRKKKKKKIPSRSLEPSAASDGYLVQRRGSLDCDDSMSLYEPWRICTGVPHQGEGTESLEFEVASPLVFIAGSIAMLHWLPVTQGSDQYWVSRAAEQAAKGLDSEYAP